MAEALCWQSSAGADAVLFALTLVVAVMPIVVSAVGTWGVAVSAVGIWGMAAGMVVGMSAFPG
jgi:hypothetical protein